MAQVLPYVPSPIEQLTPYITQAIQGVGEIGKGLSQRRAGKELQALLNPQQAQPGQQTPQQPGASPIQVGDQMQRAPENVVATADQIYKLKLKETGGDQHAALATQQAYLQDYKLREKENADVRQEERKMLAEKKKETEGKAERQANIQKTFNFATSLLAKNTPGVGISPGAATGLSRKAVEGRAAFNTLKGKFESILLPMVNKGTLAKERFNFILSQIPDASDSQREIAGKFRGLAETLGEEGFPIDTKVLDSIPWASQELKESNQGKSLERVTKGTKLTEDAALQLLEKSGGDKEKARKLARGLGYEF